MENAVEHAVRMQNFVTSLSQVKGVKNVTPISGRRFTRIQVNNTIEYFVDNRTEEIFGAKSKFQFNERRWFGTLATVDQYDWNTRTPNAGTEAERQFTDREEKIVKSYKPRGRPKRNTNA